MTKQELYKMLQEENCNKMFLEDLIEQNGDKLIHHTQVRDPNKKYESVFNYSERHGGTFDSFKYYHNYVIEIKE